jgi:hypothetical protein
LIEEAQMNGTKITAGVLVGTVGLYVLPQCPLPRDQACLAKAAVCGHEEHRELERLVESSSSASASITLTTVMPGPLSVSWPRSA